MAAVIWGHQWSKKRIIFKCDNLGTVHILCKGRSKCSSIMLLMGRLTWCATTSNFRFNTEIIPDIKKSIRDAILRFQEERFRQLAPDAEKDPVPCIPYQEIIYP